MAAQTFVNSRRIGAKKLSRKTALSLGLTLAASMAVHATVNAAAPIVVTGVEHGTAGFSIVGNTTTITAANQTIIDYSEFDVPTGDTVRFIQPGATATVLNRISGATPTTIDGNMFANGIVYMVNPAGVMFGQGAVINVGQIYAAAGNLSNSDFLQGLPHFTDVTGSVLNAGNIQASAVNFVGQMVANSGEILAPQGTVVMAAGNDVLIGKMDGNMFVKVSDAGAAASDSANAAVSNSGTVDAQGGQVNMSAGDMFSLAIHNTGTVTAGNIALHGGSNSTVLVSGKLDASNQGANGTGGTIKINGGNIGVGVDQNADGSYADEKTALTATGANGGGKILIGVKADSSSATGYSDASNYDYIGADALLNSSATVSGAGGLVDTSGATLTVSPTATILAAGASGGAAGQWLLDPVNIQITGSTSTNITSATANGLTEFSPNAATPSPATVSAASITVALSAGDNVTVSATPATGPDIGTDKGDITLVAGATINPIIPAGSNVTLILDSSNDIGILGTIASTGSGIMNVNLDAAGNIYIGGTGTTNGAGSISTFSSSSVGGNFSANSNGGSIVVDSTATWAVDTAGTLGGGSLSLNAGSNVDIAGISGTPAVPGPGGLLSGGGSLTIEAGGPPAGTSIFLGTVNISSSGVAPGTGGGAMAIFSTTGNIVISGTTLSANGAQGAAGGAGVVGAYGGGGAIGIITAAPDGQTNGQITLENITVNAEGNGGGKFQVWPGGGEAGYFYQPINPQNIVPNGNSANSYPLGDGFLILAGQNTIRTAQIGPVVTGLGTGGGIGIAVGTKPLAVTWTIAGGGGGSASYVGGASTTALAGGGISIEFRPTYTFTGNPSSLGSSATGVAAGIAGPSEFDAFNTYFESYLQSNGGGSYTTIQPTVTSDGGGQDYENAILPPGEPTPTGYKSAPYIVGDIIIGGTQGVTTAATATLADTGTTAAGTITLDGTVDAVAPGVDSLITTTAAGDISYRYTLGQNIPLLNWTAIAGTALTTSQFIPVTGTDTLATGLGQIQLAAGPSVSKPNFDIPFGEGFFYGTTTGNILIQGAVVDANTNNIGTNTPFWPGAVTINTTALSGSVAGDIDLEAYLYGPFNQTGGFTAPLTLISPAPSTLNGQPNNAITVDGTVVPVEAIYAVGGYTPVIQINSAGGYQDTATPVTYSGLELVASNGGNIYMGGPAPGTTAGLFTSATGLISSAGYTVETGGGGISILAENPAGNSGNIVQGQSVFLATENSGEVSVASIGTTGNAGNITFEEGAKINGFDVAITSLNLSANPTAGYTSGNIVWLNLTNPISSSSQPTNFATESFIHAYEQADIISGNYLGSAGNINIGSNFQILAAQATSTVTNPIVIESVASPTGDPTGGMTNALATVNAATPAIVPATQPPIAFTAPRTTGLTGLTGNAGYVSVGAYADLKSGGAATFQPGSISIGSYSSIGNASAVGATGNPNVGQNIYIGTSSTIASSGGPVSIFSEAVLNSSYTTATSASPGSIAINGTVSTVSSGSAGNISIQNVGTGTVTGSPGTTIAGTGLLQASSLTSHGGYVSVYAPYGVVTIDLTTAANYAVDVDGNTGAGDVDIYGSTGVNIVAGGISARGGINSGKGGGGGVSIASGGWINVNQANINASSAYGGGGGVAVFSTNTTGATIPVSVNALASSTSLQVDLGSNSYINTSGGGYGGGGAILIAGTGNVTMSGSTLIASGNGGGALAINSASGKIIFSSTNNFTSLQTGTANTSFGGGGGYSAALTASPATLQAGGGGGANGGVSGSSYAGGGVALTGTPSIAGGLFTDGVTVYPGGGSAVPGGEPGTSAPSAGGSGTGAGGTAGGGNAGTAGSLAFSGNEIDFGVTGSTTPVSLTTNGNGQIYNANIVLFAPTTLTESGSGNIVFNNTSTPTTISTAPGVTAGLTVVDNSGNIVFGNNFSFITGSTALSSLSVTDTSGQIQLFSGGGNFTSVTSGAQTFSGTTLVEETGSTGTFDINAGGEITLTGSLTGVVAGTTTAQPLAVSLTSSQAYASGAYAIDVGLNVNTGGGNFLADASGGGNIQLGLTGTGATASTINTSGSTSNGSITIESIASTGNSGGIVMSSAGESLITGGAGTSTGTPTGPGSVLIESSAVAGTAHNINITGAIDTSSTTGNGGYVTVETIGQAGTTGGNITIGNSTGAAGTGYITTVSTAAGSTGGNVVLNSGTGTVNVNTAGDPGVAINTSGFPGGSITLTGFDGLTLTAGNIISGGGSITINNTNGMLAVNAVTLDSSAATGGGVINIATTGSTANVTLNGATINSGSSSTNNGGTIAVNSAGTLTLSGADTFNSQGPGNGTGTPGAITFTAAGNLTQTSTGSLLFNLSGDALPLDVTFNPGPSTPTGTVNLAGALSFTGTYTGTTGPEANLVVNSLGALALGTMNGNFALNVNSTDGDITFNGPLGQTAALNSVTANAGTGSGVTTGGVTVNGAITTVGNITLQPNSGYHLGGAGAGDYRPDGVLAINANLTSNSGNILLSADGLPVVPSVATISSSGPVTIYAAGGNVTIGQNERFTARGSLAIDAPTGTATVGDLYSLGSINVGANAIDILLRQPGALLTSIGSLDSGVSSATDGTNFVSNGPITFTGSITLGTLSGSGTTFTFTPATLVPGSLNPPRFTDVTASGSVPGYTISAWGAGTPFAGQAISPQLITYGSTVLALTADGPTAQIVQVFTQNAAPLFPPQGSNNPVVEYTAVMPPVINSWDQAILQGVGVNASYIGARQILAGMMGPVVYESSTSSAGQFTPGSVQHFLNVYHNLFSFEVPANYSPYNPSDWFTRPTWYEVAGRHKDIHNTLSLAYSLYQDSLGASPANETFLQFVDHNRTQSKIFTQAASYMVSLQELTAAMYQMGITPAQFTAIEVKFFKPLAPDGMPFGEFMSEIAPAQLLPAGTSAE